MPRDLIAAAAVAAALLGSPGGVAAQEHAMEISIPYRSFTLDNGLRVLVHEDHSVPVVAVNLWYHVGSANERPGRTGFAHLFEHLMFEGSAHVPEGQFDELLEGVGAINNGSTDTDRTNYWETLPPNGLELALYLEADRMGWLEAAITEQQLEAQRGVVKNERRQSYENRPYGLAYERLSAALYPADHPYHWPTIGSMADLDAATLQDVVDFFRTYYAPGNASLAIAGDVDFGEVRALVEKYFADIPPGPEVPEVHAPDATLPRTGRLVLEDDVQLPRLYVAWHSPAHFAPGDAALDVAASVLADGRTSRLYRTLVYDRQVAQDVSAYQSSARLGSEFTVVVTARPEVGLAALEAEVRAELGRMAEEGVSVRELERARNARETGFVDALQTVGGFGGKADRLNQYQFYTGEPDWAGQDLARYRTLTPAAVQAAVRRWLAEPHSVVLSVVPRGRADLAAREHQ
jgi:zinc protease